ncbi:MAG TPA: hypothetical protein VIX19_11515 [Terriglobales bacterium]
MERFQITLKGLPPGMLQNKMGINELLALRDKTGKKSKVAARPSLEEEAAAHIHYNGDGHPCVPKDMLMATLINAGVFIRLDQKRQLSTKESSLLPGLLILEGDSYPLLLPGDGEESTWGLSPWRYEVRQGRNPNGGEAVCIVRPLFEKWAISFTGLLDTRELPEDTFLRLFGLAGSRIGIGDFRPQRKGTFGMFAITNWKKLGDASDVWVPKAIAAGKAA